MLYHITKKKTEGILVEHPVIISQKLLRRNQKIIARLLFVNGEPPSSQDYFQPRGENIQRMSEALDLISQIGEFVEGPVFRHNAYLSGGIGNNRN
jgi:hypothetical protein